MGLLLGDPGRPRPPLLAPADRTGPRAGRCPGMSDAVPLRRRAVAECAGTAALVAVVVGSGIQAASLSHDVGVQLLANSLATVFGLGVLIALLGPVSGAHFNPVVSLAAWWTGRAGRPSPSAR
ncbi:aquaporin, partial [Actinacidiphila rubida]|uniref:aquaporin n=1 Tax=Actinacidiphila rubida TaxID=310780 RepID=UPI00396A3ADC